MPEGRILGLALGAPLRAAVFDAERERELAAAGAVVDSRTGRAYIAVVGPLGARVLLADPYVTPAEAEALGAELLPLPELLPRCRIACLHAPATAATRHPPPATRHPRHPRHLLGAAELRLLPEARVA